MAVECPQLNSDKAICFQIIRNDYRLAIGVTFWKILTPRDETYPDSSQPPAAPSRWPSSPHGSRVYVQLRRLPLADDPIVDLNHTTEIAVNLEPVTDVRQPVQAVEEYRPVVEPDGVASGAIANAAKVQ